ncbi:hypothetical protein ACIBKZ_32295 [Streptomyces sp. NPDC050421]|uniref:hypothetical protein n=1 Tax=Streptomyces sp. NPDC050421 TaxID=3365613 RepID=UPI00378CE415
MRLAHGRQFKHLLLGRVSGEVLPPEPDKVALGRIPGGPDAIVVLEGSWASSGAAGCPTVPRPTART